jgi:hypothetical protein
MIRLEVKPGIGGKKQLVLGYDKGTGRFIVLMILRTETAEIKTIFTHQDQQCIDIRQIH